MQFFTQHILLKFQYPRGNGRIACYCFGTKFEHL